MKRLSCIGTALLIVSAMSTAAWADDPPAGGEPAAPAAPPPHAAMASHKFTGDEVSYYITGGVADNAMFSVGVTLPNGFTFAIGGAYEYNGAGLPGPAGPTTDKNSFQGLIYGAYYFYNKFPVGIAAEAAVVTPLTPHAADVVTIQPGLALYYAPFAAPVVIGTALDLQINLFRDDLSALKQQVKTVTPGVRLVYVFP
jgi:hypothetical protein